MISWNRNVLIWSAVYENRLLLRGKLAFAWWSGTCTMIRESPSLVITVHACIWTKHRCFFYRCFFTYICKTLDDTWHHHTRYRKCAEMCWMRSHAGTWGHIDSMPCYTSGIHELASVQLLECAFEGSRPYDWTYVYSTAVWYTSIYNAIDVNAFKLNSIIIIGLETGSPLNGLSYVVQYFKDSDKSRLRPYERSNEFVNPKALATGLNLGLASTRISTLAVLVSNQS